MKRMEPRVKNQRSRGVYLATGFLIISLVFVAVTFFQLTIHARHEQEWISQATEVQVTSQQLAKSAGEAAAGNLDAFLELKNARNTIDRRNGQIARRFNDRASWTRHPRQSPCR